MKMAQVYEAPTMKLAKSYRRGGSHSKSSYQQEWRKKEGFTQKQGEFFNQLIYM